MQFIATTFIIAVLAVGVKPLLNCQGALCFGDWCLDLFVKDIVHYSVLKGNNKSTQKYTCKISKSI